jgi:hypothetical protein
MEVAYEEIIGIKMQLSHDKDYRILPLYISIIETHFVRQPPLAINWWQSYKAFLLPLAYCQCLPTFTDLPTVGLMHFPSFPSSVTELIFMPFSRSV